MCIGAPSHRHRIVMLALCATQTTNSTLGGDSDMVVGGPGNLVPTWGNFDWASASDYVELIEVCRARVLYRSRVSFFMLLFLARGALVQVPGSACPTSAGATCIFYIGVQPFPFYSNASYSLLVGDTTMVCGYVAPCTHAVSLPPQLRIHVRRPSR